MSPVESVLLDAEQVAQILNVPKSWVLTQARADRLPHVKLGHYVRFSRAEIDRWIVEQARGGQR